MRAYFTLRRTQYVGVLTCLSLLVGGCSMFSGETKVHKNAKGSVYLKEVADWSFEASHPAVIDPMTMLKVVKGVVTDSASQMPASGSKPMRVFSDEDAASPKLIASETGSDRRFQGVFIGRVRR
jgi:hypothetical protein